jgi:DNA-binding transcriptional LysR family regulator
MQKQARQHFPTIQRSPQWFESIDSVSLSQAFLVANYASISRAARALGVNQAAISRRIKSLEDGLGVSLFERESNGIRMTYAGRRFVDRTRAAFAEIESAVRDAAAAGRGAEGVIRIGIFPGPMPLFLTELVTDFREAHPNVGLDFVACPMRELIATVVGRSLDIAIIAGANPSRDCDAESLWRSRIRVVLPGDHVLAICEAVDWMYLRDERFIFGSVSASECLRDVIIPHIGSVDPRPSVENFSVCQEALFQLVALGVGVSLTSESCLATSYSGIVIRPLSGDGDWVDHSVVWLPENDNPALRRLLSMARVKTAQQRSARSSTSDSDSMRDRSTAHMSASPPVGIPLEKQHWYVGNRHGCRDFKHATANIPDAIRRRDFAPASRLC